MQSLIPGFWIRIRMFWSYPESDFEMRPDLVFKIWSDLGPDPVFKTSSDPNPDPV